MKIIFATGNQHKVEEVKAILGDSYEVLSLKDLAFEGDIIEDGSTFAENATIKAKAIYEEFKTPCFAEDSGLEVDALEGAPGIYSARYAGEHGDNHANNTLLLKNLEKVENRAAQFHSAIAYFDGTKTHLFEGIIRGTITKELSGPGGFGYDPIFQPIGHNDTFGVLPGTLKNKISHRAISMSKFIEFLKK